MEEEGIEVERIAGRRSGGGGGLLSSEELRKQGGQWVLQVIFEGVKVRMMVGEGWGRETVGLGKFVVWGPQQVLPILTVGCGSRRCRAG